MALFDWANKEKTRAEAEAENNRRWEAWLARKDEAEEAGRDFTEPPPSRREKEAQVA